MSNTIKRPEFLWSTELGDIYCECKQENSADNKVNKRAMKLFEIFEKPMTQMGRGMRGPDWI